MKRSRERRAAIGTFCALALCVACSGTLQRLPGQAASTTSRFASVSELRAVDLAAALGSYYSTGAVWVEGQPLVVNQAFDFAIASMLPDVGPGLAAQRRIAANQQLAATIAGAPDVALHDAFAHAQLGSPTACGMSEGTRIYLYGMIFARPNSLLQLVLELRAPGSEPLRLIHRSSLPADQRPESWTAEARAALSVALRAGVEQLARDCARTRAL